MEITYKNKLILFDNSRAKLPIMLKNKCYYVPWGRRKNEEGALPTMPYIADDLLKTGVFEGFKQQLVPILADTYKTEDNRGYLVPDVLQPGQFIQGLMLELNNEKRVYVVGLIFKGSGGHYVAPKMMWKS